MNWSWTQLRRPTVWILFVLAIMVADVVTPVSWAICIGQLVLLPIAWRLLHRRFISKLTIVQIIAVMIPGFMLAFGAMIDGDPSQGDQSTASWGVQANRVWTLGGLISAGYFHVYLQGRLRKRLEHQRTLQQRVRRRSNQIRRVNLALRDEVARRQATQHRLDQSETTFQSVIDRMQLQVARKNVEGVITYANDQFCSELGLPPSQVVGSTDSDLYEPAIAAKYRADDLNVMMTGRAVDKIEDHPGTDGRVGYAQVFKAPEYDQHGQCIGIQVIFWDITERHRQSIALRDSEARKRALFNAAGDAMLLVDARGRIVEANPSAQGLLRVGGGRLIGRPLEELVNPEHVDAGQHSSSESLEISWDSLPLTERHVMRLCRADGSSFVSEVSAHAIPTGEETGRAIIIRDVTLQRQAFEAMREAKAAAEQANLTKTQFMAGISHELRTPLGGIRGLTDLLAGLSLPTAARRYVNLIMQSTELLSDVIEDILDFAAIEAGRVAIDPVPIDLHDVVGDSFACLAVRVSDKPVRLALSIHPSTPRHVIADAKRVRQIIVNLAGNAIKFTAKGEVAVRLEPINAPERSNETNSNIRRFLISVADTGIGIEPENQARIFSAFEQADRGTNKRFGGTGLGLAIAKGLAERMGGGISVTSTVGVGSEFRCELDLPINAAKSLRRRVANENPRLDQQLAVVSVGNPTIERGIKETLVSDSWKCMSPEQLSKLPDAKVVGNPIHWILTDKMSDAAWRVRARKTHDRVLWLIHAGDPTPRRAKREDTIIFEPLHPDELHRWLRREPVITSKTTPDRRRSRGVVSSAPMVDANITTKPEPEGPALNLLVVDDSATNRLVIHDQLVMDGHTIFTAAGGQEAIDRAATSQLDCILMDLQMPEMDGTEATIEIIDQARRSGRVPPPIIALTAHVTDEHREQCRRAGMSGYVTKPVNFQLLMSEIRRVTRSKQTAVEPTKVRIVEPVDVLMVAAMSSPLGPSIDQPEWRMQLAKHCGGDEKTIDSICVAFQMEVPDLLRSLKLAAAEGNEKKLKAAAHTLKSCLRYVAPPADVDCAAIIEKSCSDPSWMAALQNDQRLTEHELSPRECVARLQVVAKQWLTTIDSHVNRTSEATS